jgi:Peptidase family M28
MRMRAAASCLLFFSLRLFAQNDSGALALAAKTIQPAEIRAHMRFLSDSLLAGRAPGTPGYDIAARYVATELEGMGLEPAASGSWFEQVPLEKAVTDEAASSLTLSLHGQERKLVNAKDYILSAWFANPARPEKATAESDVTAPVVFVGFGVTAPEQTYDDYAAVDVHGKMVAEIYGAPSAFPSTIRAFYSDSVVKSKIAVAHGAVGVLIIVLPEDWKRFPWDWVVPQIQMGEMHWINQGGVPHEFFPELRGQAFLSETGAKTLFAGSPQPLDEAFEAARKSQPQGFALPVSARIHTVAHESLIHSANIIAELKGSDPRLRDQYVVYSAHVDHLGICPAIEGDNVCHGAIDNASGASTLLEIARAYASLPAAPRRSMLFVFVTGEEMGLLGSDYFAHFPTVPLPSIVANINIDGAPGAFYPMKDIVALGAEHSTLGDETARAAKSMGYDLSPDPMPEEVYFIRSDQYSFVLQGVPAVNISDGVKAVDPKVNLLEVNKKWAVTRYHTPLDNMDQPMNFDSMAKLALLNFLVGFDVAEHDAAPAWNHDDFFGTTFGPRHAGTNREN